MAVENNKIIYGGDMMLFITSGATKYPVAFSTTASLSMTMDTREISSKDNGVHKNYKSGKFGWEASTDGLMAFDLTGTTLGLDDLYAYYKAGAAVDFAFATATGTTPNFTVDASKANFTGEVLITSMSLTAADGDNGTYSVSMIGLGDLVLA